MAGRQKANGTSTFNTISSKSAGQDAGTIPENLYHTTLTVIDYHPPTGGAINCLHVLGTHTTLHAAKAFAYHDALRSLNYQPSDFSIYATRESIGMPLQEQESPAATTPKPTTAATKVAEKSGAYESGYTTDTGASDTDTGGGGPPIWPYGDEVLVYARAPAGQEFLIGVVETPNTEHLASGGPVSGNTPLLPSKSGGKSISHRSSTSSAMSPRSESVPLGYAHSSIEHEHEHDNDAEEDSDTELSYVIQTKTDYNQAVGPGPSGGVGVGVGGQPQHHPTTARPRHPRRRSSIARLFQACEIEGCFPHKSEAISFAKHWLNKKKDSGMFVQYDERDDMTTPRSLAAQKEKDKDDNDDDMDDGSQWPFGEDVLVHAVAATGENYCVAVRTAEGARERFGKKKITTGGGRHGSEEGWVRSYYEDSSPKFET